jgi:DNA-binding response OmpR family regulator
MPRTVLVIEDDSAIRQGLVDALAYAGFASREAATGPAGLELAIGCDCDLVLLDLVLPGLDGLAPHAARRPTAWPAGHSERMTTS